MRACAAQQHVIKWCSGIKQNAHTNPFDLCVSDVNWSRRQTRNFIVVIVVIQVARALSPLQFTLLRAWQFEVDAI